MKDLHKAEDRDVESCWVSAIKKLERIDDVSRKM
jgi:hypothetical protein